MGPRFFAQSLLVMTQGICLVAPAQADVAKGKTLFENICAKCHRATSNLKPEKITQVLKSNDIPAHQFRLSADQQQDLLDYLATTHKNN